MKNGLIKGLLLAILILLAACDQGKEAEIPTLFPTQAQEQVAPTSTLMPTDEPATSTPVPTQVASPTSGRQEMPPTWTLTPTDTATPEPATAAPTEGVTVAAPLAACDTFGPDFTRNPTEFEVGNAVQVFWIPVDGAATYKVTLIDQMGRSITQHYTAASDYTFEAELFEAGKRYGWEVVPYNEFKDQMCYGRGDELVAVNPR
jgi:hypothetical protein